MTNLNGNGAKRAVLYARVSTDEQAEKGYSLQSQLEACRKYAADHAYQVIDAVQDEGVSGSLLRRPGLDRVRGLVERREVAAVIVHASDRLTRNLAHLLILREQFVLAGVELHYCNRGQSQDTPEGQMTENIEGVFAEYWRAKIVEGSMRGRNQKAANGKYVLGGRLPFGYEPVDGAAAILEAEAQIVRQIFAWYVYGDDQSTPCSMMEICRRLNEGGCKSPRGAQWDRATIWRVLQREIYAGTAIYGCTRRHKTPDGRKINAKQARENWIRIALPHLALVDPETFDAAQQRIKANKKLARRNTRNNYLVRGRLRCGLCGWSMSCILKHRREYYRCNRAGHTSDRTSVCFHSIVGHKVDAPVWRWLVGLLADDAHLEEGLRAMRERAEAELEPKRRELARVNGLIDKAERKIQKLIAVFSEADDAGDVAQAAVTAEVKNTGRQHEALLLERGRLMAELAQEVSEEDWQAVRAAAAKIRRRIHAATFEQMRQLIDILDVQVTLHNDEAGHWLEATCGIAAEAEIELHTRKGMTLKAPRVIVFAASLPLADGSASDGSLADSLFAGVAKAHQRAKVGVK